MAFDKDVFRTEEQNKSWNNNTVLTSPSVAQIRSDVIVAAFPGTLLLSQWITTKAIPGKTGTNHIPVFHQN